MWSIKDKRVLITGAAMGMGRLYAELAVRDGASVVVLWDYNGIALQQTVAALSSKGARVIGTVVDVSQRAAVESAATELLAELGGVDALINNAGVVVGKLFSDHTVADIERTMAINSLAPMHLTRLLLPAMLASGQEARIVNIASAAGLVSNPRMSVYCSSKWALLGWSDSLRLELLEQSAGRIRVTTVCPSYIDTGMFTGVRAPLLTPILKPEYVTARVWRAMQVGTPLLKLPITVHLVSLMRGLLPQAAFDFLVGRVFGVYKTMNDFKGHGNRP